MLQMEETVRIMHALASQFWLDAYIVWLCSSRKYPFPTPRPPTMEGNRNSEGRGIQKHSISHQVGVGFLMSFSRDAISKTGEFSKTITAALLSWLSVILLLNGLLKQELLFSSRIFYLRSAEGFFFTAYAIDSQCHRLVNKLLVNI